MKAALGSLGRLLWSTVLGCSGVGLLTVSLSGAFFPFTTAVVDPAVGKRAFREHCAACHSLDTDAGPGLGPSLSNIGADSARRRPGLGAEEYLFESIVDPGAFQAPGTHGRMPTGLAGELSRKEILGLVAFLQSQGSEISFADVASLGPVPNAEQKQTSLLDLESVERGKKLYVGKLGCVECHPLDPAPGYELSAPSLLSVGTHSREYLRQAICEPSHTVPAAYRNHLVLHSGRPYVGRLLPSTDDAVRLLIRQEDGGYTVRDLPRSELDPISQGAIARPMEKSLMPDYGDKLSQGELESLLDFLSTLR